MTYSGLMTREDPRAMNYSTDRSRIDRIVIHHNATTNKDVALNTWLQGGPANTSAHYEITPDEIIGAVGEEFTAWHSGDWDMNLRSIGLEHVNSTGAPNWEIDEKTYEQSARLIKDIADRYGFPVDREHVIPHKEVSATACPGGIDVDKLIAMANGGSAPAPAPAPAPEHKPEKPQAEDLGPAVREFKEGGNVFTAYGSFRVDDVQFINGMWQVANYHLAGGRDEFDWELNGIPADVVENVDGSGNDTILTGMTFKFIPGYDHGTIDAYDRNAVGIDFNGTGIIWFDAEAFWNDI